MKKITTIFLVMAATLSAANLFSQTVYTFQTCGATGRTGPTQSQVNATYTTGNTLNSSVTINTQGIQEWTVPATGTYRIDIAGAGGGDANSFGGRGRKIRADIFLTAGTVLQIVVGQKGMNIGCSSSTHSSGGGGGSFIVKKTGTVALFVAGGGAGYNLPNLSSSFSVSDANFTSGGNNSFDGTGTGGSSGGGGTGSSNGWGGGGGGFSTDGTDAAMAAGYGYNGRGYAFVNGALGGNSINTSYPSSGWNAEGGFGGGGGTHGCTGGGGGGGGYSGGGGGNQNISQNTGGGGGSYYISSATNVSDQGFNLNDGSVVITQLVAPCALNFDGSNDYVSVPHTSAHVGMSELTIEGWIKVNGSGTYRNVCVKGNYGWGMIIDDNNKLGYWSDPSYSNCTQAGTISTGVWTHVAIVVVQGSSINFYINGVNVGSSTSSAYTTINNGSNDPLILGMQGTGCSCNYMNGSIEELRIWNVARTQAQIQANMNCELAAQSNLVGLYHFDDGIPNATQTSYTTMRDLSSTATNGTLNNFALTSTTSNWVDPGLGQEINVKGNSVSIADGDATPSLSDSTDFGSVVSGTKRRYLIENTGSAVLNISSITLSGTNASEFTISGVPSSVAAGSSAYFYVTFNPSTGGNKTATININSNDCDESVYDYSIQVTVPGAALHFNGWNNSNGASMPNANTSVYDYISVPDNSTMDLTNNYSIEAWVYLDDNTNNTIIDKGDYRFLFQTHPNGHTGLGLYNNTMGWVYSSGTVPTGTWTHIAVTFDATAQKVVFYMNGNVLSTHSSGAFGPIASGGTDNLDITIGRQQPSSCVCNNFDGKMDELRIWTRTLCQSEIQHYMSCEIPTTATGLAANYHFNQGAASGNNSSVTTVTDASGNGNTGTLQNFALTGSTSNWIFPGAVSSGVSCGAYSPAEINLKGNSITITDGDATPSLTDSTNFGTVSGTSVTRSFTIENTGSSTLTISSIILSGTNSADFSISGAPSTVSAGSSSKFYVTFTPGGNGDRTATITINNSDCDEGVYDFAVQGGKLGQALNFDGTNDYVSVPVINLSGTNKLTLEAWVKPTDITTNTYYEIIRQDGNLDWLFSFQDNGTILSFGLNTSSGYSELDVPITASNYTDGNWHHVAAVYDGATRKIYKDGVLIGSDTKTGNITFGGSMQHIGRWPLGSEYFKGQMDELRIWNVARSCSDLKSTKDHYLTGSETGLVAYYQFNEGVAAGANATITTLPDKQTNTTLKNGTLTNFALSGANSNWVQPGSGVSGTTPDPQPEINVKGNTISIADGDNTPSPTDSTDFGTVANGTKRRFLIENTGTGALSVSSIVLSGTNAADFSISGAPSSVAAGSSAYFYVTVNASSGGTKTATITINNGDCDESVYDFAIQAVNGTAEALNFDGTNDYITLGNPSALDFSKTNALSIEAWIKASPSSASDYQIVSKMPAGFDHGYGLQIGNVAGRSGKLEFYLIGNWASNNALWIRSNYSPNICDNTWHHIAATYDGSNTLNDIHIYVDGVDYGSTSVSSSSISGSINNTEPLQIGANPGTGSPSEFMTGSMDEIRIWSVKRTCAQIKSTMNHHLTGSETGLVAYYNFNQGVDAGNNSTVTTLNDATSNSLNGTLTNFALTGSSSNWIKPGSGVSGTTPDAQPEINVKGNSLTILDEDITPSLTDSTNFGIVSTGTKRRYTIENTGTAALTISSITLGGTNPGDFAVSGAPSSVSAGGSATFYVQFNPTAGGVRTATLNISSNDCDESPYNYNIQGQINCTMASPVATSSTTHVSAVSVTEASGWTCYCNSGGELLLALKLGGTGAVIPSAGGVELKITSPNATWYPHGTGFVGNYNGWAGLDKTWEVYPTTQPTSSVPVRFFVSSADISAVNTTLSAHSASPISSPFEMSFYKVINSSKPAHSPIANLAQSDVNIYCNTSTANGEITFLDSAYGGGKYHVQFSVNSFSGGGGGSGGSGLTPLPVQILTFTGKREGSNGSVLNWTAVSDLNDLSKFEVQRSNSMGDFITIGSVNPNNDGTYNYHDQGLLSGKIYYYRLKIYLLNGTYSYSKIVAVSIDAKSTANILVFPVPTSEILHVNYNVETTNSVSYHIVDASGKQVLTGSLRQGPNSVNVTALKEGVYMLQVLDAENSGSFKVIISR